MNDLQFNLFRADADRYIVRLFLVFGSEICFRTVLPDQLDHLPLTALTEVFVYRTPHVDTEPAPVSFYLSFRKSWLLWLCWLSWRYLSHCRTPRWSGNILARWCANADETRQDRATRSISRELSR